MTSESTIKSQNDDLREYVKVVHWDLYQYSDRRKNPNPPWPWFRLQAFFLRSPEWLGMKKPMRADFISVLSAANATGNMIPMCRSWLRAFDLSPNILQKLNKTGLTQSFFLPPNDKRIKDLRLTFSGGIRLPEVEAEAEAEKKGQLSPFLNGDGDPIHSINKLAKNAPSEMFAYAPLPLHGRGQGGRDVASLVARSGERWNCNNTPRKDPRPFDQLKSAILPIAKKLDTRDPGKILRLGGQTLKISPKQCAAAVQQLIEDGKL